MRRSRFIRQLRQFCRKTGRSMSVDFTMGKGSHAGIKVDDKRTIIKAGELTPKEIRSLLRQLGLPSDALE
jgi:hypothetical protein